MVRPDSERLSNRIAHLATIIDPAQPPYTRRAFSTIHQQGREWLASQFAEAGLEVFTDVAGNLVGRLKGTDPEAGLLATGSHSDTVMGGGRFDGIAGVLCGLEAIQALQAAGTRLRHDVAVVDFLAEEPTDYGPSCIGSRALSGTLTEDMLQARNEEGEALGEALRRIGGDPQAALAPPEWIRPLAGFLELHIEQGPVLEQEGIAIGVVTGVVGIRRLRLTVTGQADHAGTTPMDRRRDALAGASMLIARMHELAADPARTDGLVATVGRLHVRPNAANVVPEQVTFSLDARCLDMEAVQAVTDRWLAEGRDRLNGMGLMLEAEMPADVAPAAFDPRCQQAVQAAAEELGLSNRHMPSGAGHDAMHLAPLWPSGMIFVPSQAGRSHASEEYTAPEQLAAGTAVLADALRRLDDAL